MNQNACKKFLIQINSRFKKTLKITVCPGQLISLGMSLICLSMLAACSMLPDFTIPGMDRLTGEKGIFRDRQGEYLRAESLPRTEIPPDFDSIVIDDLLVIPEINATDTVVFLDVPRPREIEGRSNREVVIQRMENSSWIIVDVSPSELWPRIRDYWRERKVEIAFENPTGGVMDTGWFVLEGSLLNREKIRVTVDTGFQADSAEIRLLHMSSLQSAPALSQVIWPEISMDSDIEYATLTALSTFLADIADLYQASSVSFLAGSIPTAGKAVLTASPSGEEVLRLQANFNRSWAAIGRAMNRAGVETVSQDSAAGIYEVLYTPGSEDQIEVVKPGIFKRIITLNGLFSNNDNPIAQSLHLQLIKSGTIVEVRVLPSIPEPSAEAIEAANRLIKILHDTIA